MEDTSNQKNIQCATQKPKSRYSKKYYIMFFTVMVVSFVVIFYICNYTKLKEMFQVVALTALAISIAEYTTRRYLDM